MSDATGTDTGPDAADGAATANDEADDQTQNPETDTASEDQDWKAQAEKWKAIARRHEKTARTATQSQKELEQLRQSSMTEQERAVAEAREEGKREASKSHAERLARSEIKAALSTLVDDPSDIIEDLNLSKYVTDDGEVDDEAVAALKARYTSVLGRRAAAAGTRSGHGRQGSRDAKESPADQFAETVGNLLSRS